MIERNVSGGLVVWTEGLMTQRCRHSLDFLAHDVI